MLRNLPGGRWTLVGSLAIVAAFGATALTGRVATVEGNDGAVCSFTITATNRGNVDIWILFYKSKVKQGCVTCQWRQLEIQDHRVAAGLTDPIKRRYDAHGPCYTHRDWQFELKKGASTDFLRVNTGKNAGGKVDIGDVSRAF